LPRTDEIVTAIDFGLFILRLLINAHLGVQSATEIKLRLAIRNQ